VNFFWALAAVGGLKVIEPTLAVVSLALGIYLSPRGQRFREGLVLLIVAATGSLIFGAGIVLQALIGNVFLWGHHIVYALEFETIQILKWIATSASSGLLPGSSLAVLILRTRVGRSYPMTGGAAALLLIMIDLAHAAEMCQELSWPAALALMRQDLPLSIVSDAVGGPIGGLLCWLTANSATSLSLSPAGTYRSLAIAASKSTFYTLALVGVILISYMMFVHPISERVSLVASEQRRQTIIFGTSLESLTGMRGEEQWSVTLPSIHVIKPRSFDTNLLTTLSSGITFSREKPIPATIVATQGCKSPLDSLYVAAPPIDSASGVLADLRGVGLGLSDVRQIVSIFGPNLALLDGTISLAHLQKLQIDFDPNDGGVWVGFPSEAHIDVSMPARSSIVIQGRDMGGAHVLSVATHDHVSRMGVVSVQDPASSCRTAGIVDPPLIERPSPRHIEAVKTENGEVVTFNFGDISQDVGYVIKPTVTGISLTSIVLDNASLYLPHASVDLENVSITYFKSEAVRGTLQAGLGGRFELTGNDIIELAGSAMTLSWTRDKAVVVDGEIPYVVINGQRITKSFFGFLPLRYQTAVLAPFGVLWSWLIVRAGRALTMRIAAQLTSTSGRSATTVFPPKFRTRKRSRTNK
jgi:hypothetical protein